MVGERHALTLVAAAPPGSDPTSIGERPESPLTDVRVDVRLSLTQRAGKRAVDIALALPLLFTAIPVMVVIAIAVACTSRGPVFFRQTRVGRGGTPITVTKFRTMYVRADERLAADPSLYRTYRSNDFKLPPGEDPRVTRLGRHLRNLSLDELPQLWDVVVGRMSLVGPRPVVPDELECYQEYAPAYLAVRPGLTGVWQVSGRCSIRYPERARLDHHYVATWSLRNDISILIKTVRVVALCNDAH
jgi:lipopolysaccharide/colanic/teichoic acid biosynthesis glycosyltransferase